MRPRLQHPCNALIPIDQSLWTMPYDLRQTNKTLPPTPTSFPPPPPTPPFQPLAPPIFLRIVPLTLPSHPCPPPAHSPSATPSTPASGPRIRRCAAGEGRLSSAPHRNP